MCGNLLIFELSGGFQSWQSWIFLAAISKTTFWLVPHCTHEEEQGVKNVLESINLGNLDDKSSLVNKLHIVNLS